MTRILKQLTLILALAALLPAPAAFAGGQDVKQDCSQDDSVDGKYTRAELQNALNNLGGDLDEYSNCRAAITAALHGGPTAKGAGTKGGPDGGGSGSGPLTPAQKRERERAERAEQSRDRLRQEVEKAGAALGPSAGPGTIEAASAAGGMPASLLLVLLGLLSLGMAGVVFAARRNPTFAKALRSVPLPKLRR
jgi:hypothetical protein